MRHSTDRILVSHAGNLPRPPDLDILIAHGPAGKAQFTKRLPSAVKEIVARQIECGVDVVNDGEFVKAGSYGGYIQERTTGWVTRPLDGKTPKRGGTAERDRLDFPGTFVSGLWMMGSGGPIRPGFATPGAPPPPARGSRVCVSPIKYTGQDAIKQDVANFKAALAGHNVEGCITALGPLSLGAGAWNEHYGTEEQYMMAVAEALREEYKAITDAGLILQLDEPEFCTTWSFYPSWTVEDARRYLSSAVEVINHAIEGLPRDQIRFHTCWGSGHRPHTNDLELKHFADLLVKINAQEYSIEAANVRHDHEWEVWKDVKLPEGSILMPGVLSHATDLVEHPGLVAQRLVNYASVVGKENVKTGTDCGIGSRVGHVEIVWAKLKAMAEGARLASERLWKH